MALTKISTDGVKDDAITKAKIPANQIEASELANNAVDTNAIADQAVTLDKLPHGDANNDGKFLRANNGADPSYETVSSVGGATGADFNDDVKARFGTGNDLEIYHNTQNWIKSGVDGVTLHIDHDLTQMRNHGGTQVMAKFIENGAVELNHNGTKQCETSANGLAFPNGKGIDFSATANAALFSPDYIRQANQGYDPSTDSEVLTHYEHGTWTPRLRAYDHTNNAAWGYMVYTDGTVVEGQGRYVRVGRLVWAGFNIETGSKQFDTGWTYWSIDTIPFGANHYDGRSGGVQVFQTNAFTDTTNIIGGRVHGADAYLTGTRPNGEYNATINTSNT